MAPVALIAATITTGLIAGLFYAFACSVMPALRGTDARTFIDVMQRVNRAILNGWFAAAFAGAFLLTAQAAVLHIGEGPIASWPRCCCTARCWRSPSWSTCR
ncbi:hypothetical protein N599_29655 [Saccharopolyspora erythraea D]|nr:hypothetical protein N599_29655 [Saccharopolyspora erythraea D]